jgi:hypothetical protein
VDESANGMGGNNSKEPQHDQDYEDCPQHQMPPIYQLDFQQIQRVKRTFATRG